MTIRLGIIQFHGRCQTTHIYLALAERVKQWMTAWNSDASHSEVKSKDNAIVLRYKLPGLDRKKRLRDESDDKDLRGPTGWERANERWTALFLRAPLVLLIGFSIV